MSWKPLPETKPWPHR